MMVKEEEKGEGIWKRLRGGAKENKLNHICRGGENKQMIKGKE